MKKNKKIKKKTFLSPVLFLILLLFLTACKKETYQGGLTTNFKVGYQGLAVSLVENTPPETLYPESEFKIILKVENKGAYPAKEGRVSLLGFDEKYVSLKENQREILSFEEENVLAGKNALNPEGDLTYVEFEGKVKELFPGSEEYRAPYFIEVEYKYETVFNQMVCLNPRPYEIYDAGCQIKPETTFDGQGSPLAITQLEEILFPGINPSVEFRFTLTNKGKGEIKDIRLEQAKVSNKPLACEFKEKINPSEPLVLNLQNPETILVCRTSLEEKKSYSAILFIKLSFDYSLKLKEELVIKKS